MTTCKPLNMQFDDPLLSTSDRAVELSVEAWSHGASVTEVSQLQTPGGKDGEVDVGARSFTEPTN